MVVVPRRSRLPWVDLLISRCRLWPQLRLILPVAVRPNRFFAPLLVLSLGIFRPLPMVAAARHARLAPYLKRGERGPPPIEAGLYSGPFRRRQGEDSWL